MQFGDDVQSSLFFGFSTVDFRYDACGLWTTFRYQYPARVVGDTENVHETTLVGHEKGMKRAQKGHEKILEFIKDNPQISIPALAKEFGITVKAMRLTLDKLKAEKRISRIGPNKGGYWQIMDMQRVIGTGTLVHSSGPVNLSL